MKSVVNYSVLGMRKKHKIANFKTKSEPQILIAPLFLSSYYK